MLVLWMDLFVGIVPPHPQTTHNQRCIKTNTAHQVMLRCFFFFTTFGDALSTTSQAFLPGFLASENWLAVGKVRQVLDVACMKMMPKC